MERRHCDRCDTVLTDMNQLDVMIGDTSSADSTLDKNRRFSIKVLIEFYVPGAGWKPADLCKACTQFYMKHRGLGQ